MVEGQGVGGKLQIGEGGLHIREGLVHDDDEVFRRLATALRSGVPGGDGRGCIGRVVLRGGDEAVAQGGHEVEQKAVGLGLPLLGVDADGGQEGRKEKDVDVNADGGAGGGDGYPAQLLPPPGTGAKLQRQEGCPVAKQNGGGDVHGSGEGIVVVRRHVQGGLQAQQVAGEDDAAPEGEDIVVGKAREKAKARSQSGAQEAAARHHADQPEDEIVPDGVQRHLGRGQGGEGVIFIQDLHHQKGQPGAQEKEKALYVVSRSEEVPQLPPPAGPAGDGRKGGDFREEGIKFHRSMLLSDENSLPIVGGLDPKVKKKGEKGPWEVLVHFPGAFDSPGQIAVHSFQRAWI